MILKIQKKTSYLSDAETQFFRSGSDQYRFGSEQYFSTVFRITQILLRIIRITTFSLPDQLPYGFFRMTEVGCMRICFPQIFQFAQICTLNFYIFQPYFWGKKTLFPYRPRPMGVIQNWFVWCQTGTWWEEDSNLCLTTCLPVLVQVSIPQNKHIICNSNGLVDKASG